MLDPGLIKRLLQPPRLCCSKRVSSVELRALGRKHRRKTPGHLLGGQGHALTSCLHRESFRRGNFSGIYIDFIGIFAP